MLLGNVSNAFFYHEQHEQSRTLTNFFYQNTHFSSCSCRTEGSFRVVRG